MHTADAAEYYEKAWECEGESSAPIGYKLAFNYLKAGEFFGCTLVWRFTPPHILTRDKNQHTRALHRPLHGCH